MSIQPSCHPLLMLIFSSRSHNNWWRFSWYEGGSFNTKSKRSCQLADLPGQGRQSASLCGRLLCGGGQVSAMWRTCLMLDPITGVFTTTSVTLREGRYDHLCWDVEGENGPTLLMGGLNSETSTELVSSDGSSSSASFTLKYATE